MRRPSIGAGVALAGIAMSGLATTVLATTVLATTVLASPAIAAPASPDLRARDLFQQQRYADALAIYTDLYARTHHPTYLRNAGRCHQMLRQPEQAIAYFQSYLHEARDLPPAERAEVEGYIAEMQALQRAGAPAPPPAAPSAALASALPSAPPETAVQSPVVDVQAPAPTATPLTHQWWFWTGIGALVVGGVIASVAIAGHGSSRLPCPAGGICPQ